MAFYSDRSFSSFQGRAHGRSSSPILSPRFRLPVVTLVLGAIASLVIAAGALDWMPTGSSLSNELSSIEYLTGTTAPKE
ncbi:hypothetical protein [Pacificibacter marinus]|uniref:hypothetical protein n=1 Tax=Pacificibacter marinus TaxID=658057 RepID=UPI001C07DEB4|nr:hypothetical protein [Pacificibacter marinus]MBU2866259.1 hypothetical protein [Pacificibacter marinus]